MVVHSLHKILQLSLLSRHCGWWSGGRAPPLPDLMLICPFPIGLFLIKNALTNSKVQNIGWSKQLLHDLDLDLASKLQKIQKGKGKIDSYILMYVDPYFDLV